MGVKNYKIISWAKSSKLNTDIGYYNIRNNFSSETIKAQYIYWVLKITRKLLELKHQSSIHILGIKNYKIISWAKSSKLNTHIGYYNIRNNFSSETIKAQYIYWVLKITRKLLERKHQGSIHILIVKNYKKISWAKVSRLNTYIDC